MIFYKKRVYFFSHRSHRFSQINFRVNWEMKKCFLEWNRPIKISHCFRTNLKWNYSISVFLSKSVLSVPICAFCEKHPKTILCPSVLSVRNKHPTFCAHLCFLWESPYNSSVPICAFCEKHPATILYPSVRNLLPHNQLLPFVNCIPFQVIPFL